MFHVKPDADFAPDMFHVKHPRPPTDPEKAEEAFHPSQPTE